MTNRKYLVIILTLILLFLSACDDTSLGLDTFVPDPYEVDSTFREFYGMLGGRDTLGPAISPLFMYGEVKYQYTVAALMVHDPTAPGNQRFQLAALGLDMGISEPAVSKPKQQGLRYIDGHIVAEIFLSMYERMGGARYVGRPLTELHYNPDKRRYEQYFENLGFYWLVDSSAEDVRLQAYGAWKCDASCRQPSVGSATVVLPFQINNRFKSVVERLGADFTGFALTDAYETPDGFLEQVFENVVLVSTSNKPRRVFLRAVSERLGTRPDPLAEPTGLGGFQFHEVRDGRGYNVLNKFLDYLAVHGGLEVSGAPIGEFVQLDDYTSRQCFTNLCLDLYTSPSGYETVRPAQLGYIYRQLAIIAVNTPAPEPEQPERKKQPEADAPQSQDQPSAPAPEPEVRPEAPSAQDELSIRVWELYPMVSPNDAQEIGVGVFENGVPLQNIEPDIIVVMPDGRSRTYYMYPTNPDGQTSLAIDPIDAPGGTLIPYQVCIYNLNGSKLCVKDSFLVWTNP